MTLSVNRVPTYNIWSRNIFPFSMENVALYLPLWQEDMQGSTLLSYDPYHHSCTVYGATWGSQGRTSDGIDNDINCGTSEILNIRNKLGILAWVKRTEIGVVHTVVDRRSTTLATQISINFLLDSNNVLYFAYRNSADTAYHVWKSTATFTDTSKFYCFGLSLTFGTGSSIVGMADGATLAGSWTTGNGNEAVINTTGPLKIGENGANAQGFKGILGEDWLVNGLITYPKYLRYYERTKWRFS